MRDLPSKELWYEYRLSIAQGCLTNSKHVDRHIGGIYPEVAAGGRGAVLTTYDDRGRKKTYIDYIQGLGANFLGMGNAHIANDVRPFIDDAWSLSLNGPHEILAANMVKEYFPFVKKVKFLKTGSGACSAAIKLARAHTGRDLILSEGYHGHHDDFISLLEPSVGVPRRDTIKPLKDLDQIDKYVGAVIVEPVITDWSPERMTWLIKLREQCTKVGAMLIFDEVLTGFRFKDYGVCNYSGVTPDLLVLGKALGGGMALSAVCGPDEIMNQDDVFISTTFAGEVLPLVACHSALKALKKYSTLSVKELWIRGQNFMDKFNSFSSNIFIEGYPTRGIFSGKVSTIHLFFQEAAKAGLLFGPSWFYNFDNVEHDDMTLSTCEDILGRIDRGEIKLEGKVPTSPFSNKLRSNDDSTRDTSRPTEERGETTRRRERREKESRRSDRARNRKASRST
jgi:glutamate-1-semialdehyde aminotransferase